MFEKDDRVAQLSFQWVVGDMRPLEKNLIQLSSSNYHYGITVLSRLIALLLIVIVAFALLPEVDFIAILLIAMSASLSLWVSWGFAFLSMRALERMLADDPHKVGWNTVWLDSSGVTWDTETSQEYTSWLGISEVVERDGSLWLKTGPAHGYYIPPAVFASNDELIDCKNLIEELRANPLPPRHLSGGDEDLVMH